MKTKKPSSKGAVRKPAAAKRVSVRKAAPKKPARTLFRSAPPKPAATQRKTSRGTVKKLEAEAQLPVKPVAVVIVVLIVLLLAGWLVLRGANSTEDAVTSANASSSAPVTAPVDAFRLGGEKAVVGLPRTWQVSASDPDYDYVATSPTDYKLFADVLTAGEASPDSCQNCSLKTVDTVQISNISYYLVGAVSQDNMSGKVYLSTCPTSFCPPVLSDSGNRLHLSMVYFPAGGPSSASIEHGNFQDALTVLGSLKFE